MVLGVVVGVRHDVVGKHEGSASCVEVVLVGGVHDNVYEEVRIVVREGDCVDGCVHVVGNYHGNESGSGNTEAVVHEVVMFHGCG